MFFTPALSRAAFLEVTSWRRHLSVVLSKDCAEPAARKRIVQAPTHPVRLQRLIVSLSILSVLAIVHSSLFCSPSLSMAHISVPLPNEHHINWNFLIKSRQKKKKPFWGRTEETALLKRSPHHLLAYQASPALTSIKSQGQVGQSSVLVPTVFIDIVTISNANSKKWNLCGQGCAWQMQRMIASPKCWCWWEVWWNQTLGETSYLHYRQTVQPDVQGAPVSRGPNGTGSKSSMCIRTQGPFLQGSKGLQVRVEILEERFGGLQFEESGVSGWKAWQCWLKSHCLQLTGKSQPVPFRAPSALPRARWNECQ